MTRQFALKQDVRLITGEEGFIIELSSSIGEAKVKLNYGDPVKCLLKHLIPLAPVPGQEIEVALEYGPWERRIFLALYDDRVWVTNDGRGWYPRWRFIPEPDPKPSAFTEEQLAELDARYARREDA